MMITKRHFLVTLVDGDRSIPSVKCTIHFPERVTGYVTVELHPTEEQFIGYPWNYSFKSEPDRTGKMMYVEAAGVWPTSRAERTWSADVKSIVLEADPGELTLAQLGPYSKTLQGSAWLTWNEWLNPPKLLTQKYTGEVELRNDGQPFAVALPNGVPVIFDSQYRYRQQAERSTLVFPELVGNYSIQDPAQHSETMSYIDDLMTLVSFATRQPTYCLGWDIVTPIGLTRHYRNRVVRTDGGYPDDALMDRRSFSEFLTASFGQFVKLNHGGQIRRAIRGIKHESLGPPDDAFRQAFSSLEGLISLVADVPKGELILSKADWAKLRGDFESAIAVHVGSASDRESMSRRLADLNRRTFADRAEEILKGRGVLIDDQWPLSDFHEGVSLYQIRNILMHRGPGLRDDESFAVATATMHVQVMVERVILALLGWPLERSSIRPEDISWRGPHQRDAWVSARRLLTDKWKTS